MSRPMPSRTETGLGIGPWDSLGGNTETSRGSSVSPRAVRLFVDTAIRRGSSLWVWRAVIRKHARAVSIVVTPEVRQVVCD